MSRKMLVITSFFALMVLAFILYSPALKLNFFYGDDYGLIKSSMQNPANYFTGDWGGERHNGGFYRPVVILSYAANRLVGGIDPFGYHLANIMFHALNAFLVFLIAYIIADNIFMALSSGALFLVFPMNTEVVNWPCCRCDSIAAAFCLLAFIFWLAYTGTKRKSYFALLLLAFIAALGSKESAIVLPVLILLYELVNCGMKKWLKEVSIIFCVYIPYFIIRYISLGTFVGGYHLTIKSAAAHIIFGPFKTIQLVYLPFVQESLLIYFIVFPVVSLACVIAIILYIRKIMTGKFFYFSLGWIAISLLPVIYLLSIGFDFRGSRFWYLSSVGISWMLAHTAFIDDGKYGKRGSVLAKGLFSLFLIYSAYFMMVINHDWAVASDMTRHIRSEAVRIIEKYPTGSAIYFWNIPDNYKGCYVGMPYLEKPFYGRDYHVWGYQQDYLHLGDLPRSMTRASAPQYIYDPDSGKFKKVSFEYIKKNNVPRISDSTPNKDKFYAFIKKVYRR